MTAAFSRPSLAFVFAATFVAGIGCSGGGGGGDDDGGSNGVLSRTTGTGLRIVHGSIEEVPVVATANGNLIQTARFVESTQYKRLPSGSVTLTVEGRNSPDRVLLNSTTPIKENVEYTVFIYGSTANGRAALSLLEDPTARPASGQSRIQVLNGLQGRDEIEAVSNVSGGLGEADFGQSTGFRDVPSGAHVITLVRSGGGVAAQVTVDAVDRGDVTLLISGSDELGSVFTQVFPDLD